MSEKIARNLAALFLIGTCALAFGVGFAIGSLTTEDFQGGQSDVLSINAIEDLEISDFPVPVRDVDTSISSYGIWYERHTGFWADPERDGTFEMYTIHPQAPIYAIFDAEPGDCRLELTEDGYTFHLNATC